MLPGPVQGSVTCSYLLRVENSNQATHLLPTHHHVGSVPELCNVQLKASSKWYFETNCNGNSNFRSLNKTLVRQYWSILMQDLQRQRDIERCAMILSFWQKARMLPSAALQPWSVLRNLCCIHGHEGIIPSPLCFWFPFQPDNASLAELADSSKFFHAFTKIFHISCKTL